MRVTLSIFLLVLLGLAAPAPAQACGVWTLANVGDTQSVITHQHASVAVRRRGKAAIDYWKNGTTQLRVRGKHYVIKGNKIYQNKIAVGSIDATSIVIRRNTFTYSIAPQESGVAPVAEAPHVVTLEHDKVAWHGVASTACDFGEHDLAALDVLWIRLVASALLLI